MLNFLRWLISLFTGKKPAQQQTDKSKKFYGDPPPDVDKPEWTCISIDPNGLQVVYQEKYGMQKTVVCIGLWESSTQYRLTWKDATFVLLEKANIVSIESKK